MTGITKSFLEQILNGHSSSKEIDHFEVTPGSKVGDGYCSLLHCVDVTMSNGQVFHLLLKHYPVEPSTQKFLIDGNIFWKEFQFYKTFVPQLVQFQEEILAVSNHINDDLSRIIRPPCAKFFYGQAVDYTNPQNEGLKECLDPLDNCIAMSDLRKMDGFQMVNRFKEFDLDHCSLVIEAQAKLHSLGWAYKKKFGLKSLEEKFTFLKRCTFDVYDLPVYNQLLDDNTLAFRKAIESIVQDKNEMAILLDAVAKARSKALDVIALYFCNGKGRIDSSADKDNLLRVPGKIDENESQWTVALHGDSWTNNFMFRYHGDHKDENYAETLHQPAAKPTEVMLVDLQLTLEGDPMIDLCYFIFSSTTSTFCQKYLTDLLKIYANTFTGICQRFNVPLPENFSLSELHRRFHRGKIYGYVSCLMNLTLFLELPDDPATAEFGGTPEEVVSIDNVDAPVNETKCRYDSSIFNQRVVDLVRELHEQGVI